MKIRYKANRFREGRMAVVDQANDILEEYARQGYDLTLRQLYYQFVARDFIPNNQREYNNLGSIINQARLAGLVDWDHITDRTRFVREVNTWDNPASIVRGAARGYQIDLWAQQDTRVECWVEKDALVGVIERACEPLRVPYLSCRGYVSQSEMWAASQRFYDQAMSGKKVVLLHLGDHDPSGIDMSRDIEERIAFFMSSDYYQSDGRGDVDDAVEWAADHFELRRLALNWDQVLEYDPPPNPAKMTDSRSAGYVERFGNQSWELDALEPSVLADLIVDAVEDVRDETLWEEDTAREESERTHLTLAASKWSDVVSFLENGEEN